METEAKLHVNQEWQTPELIVLARNQPGESVLVGCKHFPPDQGPAPAVAGCMYYGCLSSCYSLADIT
jgi:hypothetical protein